MQTHKPIPLLAAGLLTLSSVSLLPTVANAEAVSAAERLREDNRRIVTEAFDRWTAGGTGFFTDMLSPDVVWTIEGSGPSAGRFSGREVFLDRAVRPFVGRLSAPVRPVSKQVWADGAHVIINWEGKATAADGAPYSNSYVWIFRMRDGKAVEVTAFLDLTPYKDVLKRIPAPNSEPGKAANRETTQP